MREESTSELPAGNAAADTPPQDASRRRVNLSGRQADEITLRRALTLCVNALTLLTAAKAEKEAQEANEAKGAKADLTNYLRLKTMAWDAAHSALVTGRAELGA